MAVNTKKINTALLMIASMLVGYLLGNRHSEGTGFRTNVECKPVEKETKQRDGCTIKWLGYTPSQWEEKWVKNIDTLQGPDDPRDVEHWKQPGGGCTVMKNDEKTVIDFENQMSSKNRDRKIFSRFDYQKTCPGKQPEMFHIEIEPLVGFLRHPRAVCLEEDKLPSERNRICIRSRYKCQTFSKEFLLFPSAEQLPEEEKILFDLGASTYTKGPGDASQKWFVEKFRANNINFDRILAFEASPIPQDKYWAEVPADVKPIMAFYNIPVQPAPGSPDNPWNFVKSLCKPSSFCVVKLDIDNPTVEEALIATLLEDTELHALVDELVWEHHVKRSPLTWPGGWGRDTLALSTRTLSDSYEIFKVLRERGIRAHSWV
eukprot:TRINITY_DN4542_c3_g1_i1.p1 TRINITY_DN4542_c3_g1~~TRINITY_DN4542_c3_g1_i1.p1  ORF type:complete len:390 (+),score=65.69 TRINITY_DN4542_c3_g1_i1:50-1171(+)